MTKEHVPAREKDDVWDDGGLGRDEKHAKLATDIDNNALDEALELVPVSIRLQRALIDDFKRIAARNGIGYQPLMRQVLTRFAVAETRQMANDLLEQQQDMERAKTASKPDRPKRKRA